MSYNHTIQAYLSANPEATDRDVSRVCGITLQHARRAMETYARTQSRPAYEPTEAEIWGVECKACAGRSRTEEGRPCPVCQGLGMVGGVTQAIRTKQIVISPNNSRLL